MRGVVVFGVVVLFLLLGCDNLEQVEEPNWGECSMWQIYDIPGKSAYNISSSDFMNLDSVNAEILWNWLQKYDTTLGAVCVQRGGVSVRQVPYGKAED